MIKRSLLTLLALVLCFGPYSTVTMAKDNGGGLTNNNSLPFEGNTEMIDLPTPVLQVNFDDETVTDSSPNNIAAEVVGTTEYVDGVNGGKAIYFKNPLDGNKVAEQYVNFGQPDALKFGTGSFTTVFWYKTASDSKPESSVISNKDWYTGNNPGFNIGNMAQGLNLNFNALGHSGRAETDRFSSSKDNQWHHIAAVVDREVDKMILYIDGKPAKGGAGFQSNSSTVDISKHTGSIDVADFVLGADGVNHKYGLNKAAVDQLAVYKAALTPDQIGQIINRESGNIFIEQEITDLRVKVESLIIGNRYEKTAVEELIAKLIRLEEMVANLPVEEANGILNTLKEEYQNLMKGNGKEKFSFHLVSDTHVGSGSAAANFSAALTDMKNINPNAAALVTAGDNTQDGKPSEKMDFYNSIKDKKPFKDNNALIALGNHDVRGPSGALIVDPVTGETVRNVWQSVPDENNTYWNTAYKLYMENNAVYMPEDTTTTYFDRWIEGYHFIILNPENSAKDTAWMTQDQLDWLDEKLSENEDPTKPIFVIGHQSLNDTHRQSNVNNGFGPQDGAVKEILEKHPQTVFISGHAHNGFGVVEAMQRSYGVLVDLPSFSQVWNGDKANGNGYEVYVYEDEIYFSARNFVTQQWLPEHDISIKLPGLPVTYQKADQLVEENIKDSNLWELLQNAKKEAKILLNKEYDWDELVNNTPGPKLYGADTQLEIKAAQIALQKAIDSALSTLDKTASDMKMLIERFKEAGEFENDSAAHTLLMHLTAVEQYEKNESADKVVKHMNSFKILLDYQKQKGLISEKAYKVLKADADYILQKW
ncbi:FIMAH domain-containing protein [Sporosarcina sp. NPDC096371]|uniref:FIMAH domain-containing protein n=1 Tax=Sporosarcina sp. NPDC096371 TaxID=3364530 RepID=UPI00382F6D4E